MVGIQIQGKDSARTIDGVLLTTADRQIEAILGKSNLAESFSDSLYQSIVFYDGVVVPDILAFISTELNRSSGGQNVLDFSAALREGAITPAFRADAKTFLRAVSRVLVSCIGSPLRWWRRRKGETPNVANNRPAEGRSG